MSETLYTETERLSVQEQIGLMYFLNLLSHGHIVTNKK